MKCQQKNIEQRIEDYLNAGLSDDEKEAFESHVFNCDSCFLSLRLQQEAEALIRKEGKALFSDYLENRKNPAQHSRKIFNPVFSFQWLKSAPWRYVCIATLSIIFLVIAFRQIRPGNTQNIRKQYAENFIPAPYLEGMLSFQARAGEIQIRSPEMGQTCKGRIFFSWEPTDANPLFLVLLNNRGKIIRRIQVTDNKYRLKEKLMPGLYYWKLESEEEMLILGKFMIIG